MSVTVYAVQFSKYDPAEIDSLWWNKRRAEQRAEELGGAWTVAEMVVDGPVRWAAGEERPQLVAESDQHPLGVDHRELLRKYIAHVTDCEGIDYLGRLGDPMSEQDFTAEEKAELVRLASEEAGSE